VTWGSDRFALSSGIVDEIATDLAHDGLIAMDGRQLGELGDGVWEKPAYDAVISAAAGRRRAPSCRCGGIRDVPSRRAKIPAVHDQLVHFWLRGE